MNWVDYIILAIVAFSALISLFRGFIKEFISLLAWVGGLLLSLRYAGDLQPLFSKFSSSTSVRYFSAFVLIFVVVVILGIVLNFIVSKVVSLAGLFLIDRALGFVFGVARGLAIVTALLLMLAHFGGGKDSIALTNSTFAPHFSPAVQWLESFIPDHAKSITNWVQSELSLPAAYSSQEAA